MIKIVKPDGTKTDLTTPALVPVIPPGMEGKAEAIASAFHTLGSGFDETKDAVGAFSGGWVGNDPDKHMEFLSMSDTIKSDVLGSFKIPAEHFKPDITIVNTKSTDVLDAAKFLISQLQAPFKVDVSDPPGIKAAMLKKAAAKVVAEMDEDDNGYDAKTKLRRFTSKQFDEWIRETMGVSDWDIDVAGDPLSHLAPRFIGGPGEYTMHMSPHGTAYIKHEGCLHLATPGGLCPVCNQLLPVSVDALISDWLTGATLATKKWDIFCNPPGREGLQRPCSTRQGVHRQPQGQAALRQPQGPQGLRLSQLAFHSGMVDQEGDPVLNQLSDLSEWGQGFMYGVGVGFALCAVVVAILTVIVLECVDTEPNPGEKKA